MVQRRKREVKSDVLRQQLEFMFDMGNVAGVNDLIGRVRSWAQKYAFTPAQEVGATYTFATSKSKSKLYTGWFLDSGASHHICNDPKLMHNLNTSKSMSIYGCDGKSIQSSGLGSVDIPGTDVILQEVFVLCPIVSLNLISANCLVKVQAEDSSDWVALLPLVQYAINSQPYTRLQLSPFAALFLRSPTVLGDTVYVRIPRPCSSTSRTSNGGGQTSPH